MINMTNSLGISFSLPITIGWDKVAIQKRAEVNELAQGGGVIAGRLTYMPRSFNITGSIFVGEKVANNTFYDELKNFLRYEPIEISRGYDRHILAYMRGIDCNGMDDDAELELNISMIAPDPFFYGAEVLEEMDAPGTSPITISGNVGTQPTITVIVTSALAEDLAISIGDYVIDILGDLVLDDVIVINCKDYTVTLNGDSIIGSVGDDFLINGITLFPGESNVIIEMTGTADVAFLYRPLWS